MELRVVGPNQTEIELSDGNRFFFSYNTLVAAYLVGRGYIKSKRFYSSTTSKHTNAWIYSTPEVLDQEEFDNLTNLTVSVKENT